MVYGSYSFVFASRDKEEALVTLVSASQWERANEKRFVAATVWRKQPGVCGFLLAWNVLAAVGIPLYLSLSVLHRNVYVSLVRCCCLYM